MRETLRPRHESKLEHVAHRLAWGEGGCQRRRAAQLRPPRRLCLPAQRVAEGGQRQRKSAFQQALAAGGRRVVVVGAESHAYRPAVGEGQR